MMLTRVQLRRPALAVWRAPGVLQVGLDPPSVVLEGVPEELAQAIPLLSRPRTADELGALIPAVKPSWLSWLLSSLTEADMLAVYSGPSLFSVLVIGAGELAQAVTGRLDQLGISVRRLAPTGFAALPPRGEGMELVLFATGTVEPDRALTDSVFRDGRPHLVVRVEPDRAVVGPLVQPGRTPCVRCSDLVRAHLDSSWPLLLAQLCREPTSPSVAQLAWVATTSAVQVEAWRSGLGSDVCGGSLELTLPDHRLRSRTWPAHPACGCLLLPS